MYKTEKNKQTANAFAININTLFAKAVAHLMH